MTRQKRQRTSSLHVTASWTEEETLNLPSPNPPIPIPSSAPRHSHSLVGSSICIRRTGWPAVLVLTANLGARFSRAPVTPPLSQMTEQYP